MLWHALQTIPFNSLDGLHNGFFHKVSCALHLEMAIQEASIAATMHEAHAASLGCGDLFHSIGGGV